MAALDRFLHRRLPDRPGDWTVQSGPWGRVSAISTIWLTDSPTVNYADNADWAIRTTSKVDVGSPHRLRLAVRPTGPSWRPAWTGSLSSPRRTARPGRTWTGSATPTASSSDGFFGSAAAGSRYYRFRLTSDDSINSDGVFVDNVRIGCPGGTYGSGDYRSSSGTSMAAPHVAGAAAVLFSDTPAATVAEVKTALLNSGDPDRGTERQDGLRPAAESQRGAGLAGPQGGHDHDHHLRRPDPSLVDQALTVKYTVTVNAPRQRHADRQRDGHRRHQSCTGTVAAGQCTITFTTAGAKILTATYAGAAAFNASTLRPSVSHRSSRSPRPPRRRRSPPTLPDPSNPGQDVTVNFTVAPVAPGTATPTGTVTRQRRRHQLLTERCRLGRCTLRLGTAGTRTLTATYGGDPNFNGQHIAGGASPRQRDLDRDRDHRR